MAGSVLELWAGAAGGLTRHRVFPNGEVSVMLHLDAPQRLVERAGAITDQVLRLGFVAGLQEQPATFEARGVATVVGLRLSPVGAWRLLGGLPQSELAHQVVEIDAVLGGASGIARLRQRMQEAAGLGSALDVLEDWLAQRLRTAPAPHGATRAASAALARAGGEGSIEALAGECGISPRRLRELFLREVGVPAKRLARIARFRTVLDQLGGAPRGDLARLAQACGYYDQAHLCREFRALAGMTPLAYLGARSDEIHDADVVAG
jgi:AraC-like DNA-binding protein